MGDQGGIAPNPGGGTGTGYTNIDKLPNGSLLQSSFGRKGTGTRKMSGLGKLRVAGMPRPGEHKPHTFKGLEGVK